MLLLHTISSTIVYVYFFNLVAADSSFVHTTTMNISIPRNDPTEYVVYSENFALDDPEGVYYATCRNGSNPNIHLCHVVRKTLPDVDETIQIHSCADVAVPVHQDDDYKLRSMIPLASRHVALVSGFGKDNVWIIVNLLNCSTARIQYSSAMNDFDDMRVYYFGFPIVYRDHFEIVVASKAVCDSIKPAVCRFGYSYNGTKLTPKPIKLWGSNFDYTVRPLTDTKGFYSIFAGFSRYQGESVLNLRYAELSGESRMIASVVPPQSLERSLQGSQISVGHELLSVCWTFPVSRGNCFSCLQTDTNKVLVNITTKTIFVNIDWIVPFNLPNGDGILTAEWGKFDERKSFRIRWLRPDGSGTDKSLKVQSGWEEIGNCTVYSPRGIESRAGDEICIDATCNQDVGGDGWLIKRKKVCVLKSHIFEALR